MILYSNYARPLLGNAIFLIAAHVELRRFAIHSNKYGREGPQAARADAPGVGGAGEYRSVQSRRNKVKELQVVAQEHVCQRLNHTDQSYRDVEV